MKISLYFMTRNRTGYLSYSIAAWLENANHPTNIEVIVIADDDDLETQKYLKQINHCVYRITGENILYITTKRMGYDYANRYHNLAGKHFSGDVLMAPTDDMLCHEKGWDEILISSLEPYVDKPAFIWADCECNNIANGAPSPLPRMFGINRKWYDTTNHIVGWRAGDEYFKRLIKRVGNSIEVVRPKFEVYNLRQENDETFLEGAGTKSSRGACEDDNPGDFENDIKKLMGEK